MRRLVTVSVFVIFCAAADTMAGSAPQSSAAPSRAVIPTPVSMTASAGEFTIGAATTIVVPAGNPAAARIGQYLSSLIGLAATPDPLKVVPASGAAPSGSIQLV